MVQGRKGRLRRAGHKAFLLGATAAAGGGLFAAPPALASTPCTTASGVTTCSGDQSAGIQFSVPSGRTGLVVTNLSAEVGGTGIQVTVPTSVTTSFATTFSDSSWGVLTSAAVPGISISALSQNLGTPATTPALSLLVNPPVVGGGGTTAGGSPAPAVSILSTGRQGCSGSGDGGKGGTGNDAGAVTVSNAGFIQLLGSNAIGIIARSIGGGGGNAAATSVAAAGAATTGGGSKYTCSASVIVGNTGAGGGNGGAVTVTNSGAITTSSIPSGSVPDNPPPSYAMPL